jgi:oligopeptide/dipeptide ABC transporter ATP-binding protein
VTILGSGVAAEEAAPAARARRQNGRRLLGNAKVRVGLTILAVFWLLAIAGPWLAPFDPNASSPDLLQGPSFGHWLGTTNTGQDIFSQLLHGTRPVMFVAFGSGVIATLIAMVVGVTGGFLSGMADEALSMFTNIFLVLPAVPLMIIIASQLPQVGPWAVALVIAFTGWAFGARMLRAQTLSLRARDFVQAAKANGESTFRLIFFEIIPNLITVIAASLVLTSLYALLAAVTLSFIGVASLDDWNWGTVLFWAQSQQSLQRGLWWWFIPAGLCIALVGMALALINFGIDEYANPRLRTGTTGAAELRRLGIRPRVGFTPARRQPLDADGNDRQAIMSTDPVLEIRSLRVDYGYGADAVTAVSGVTLTLQRGEILGIAGESGCGKSTLAYAATRLLPPPGIITAGEVLLHDESGESVDLLSLTDAALRKRRWQDVAVVFQGALSSLNPVHRIRTQLTDAIAAHDASSTRRSRLLRARELLGMVGIDADRIDAYPHELSGGMRQRVMIAMALALEPQVLILDEPTTALDVVVQKQIVEQLLELRERLSFSVIFITHDVSLLISYADRIAVMYAGEVVELADSESIYRAPRHPYTHALLNSFPPLRGPKREVTGIGGAPPDLAAPPPGCRFHPRCPHRMAGCEQVHPDLAVSPYPGEDGRVVACLLHDPSASMPVPVELRRTVRAASP